MTRLKKERKINLRKKKVRNHKIILNISIMANKSIMPETTIRNRNKMEKLK
jgi:hypothetical protein